MRVTVFDCETTGLDPDKHAIIEIAAFSFDLMNENAATHLFHRYAYPENMVWTAYCLNLHKDILVKLLGKTIPYDYECLTFGDFSVPKSVPTEKLFTELATWHNLLPYRNKDKPESMIGAGKNFASFDLQFIKNLPGYYNIFKHRSLDPGFSYLLETDQVPPDLAECKKRADILGAKFNRLEVTHTAVDDVMDVVELLRYAYKHRKWAER